MRPARNWPRNAATLIFIFACVASALLSSAATADAERSGAVEINFPAHHTGFTSNPPGALLDLSGLVPGDHASGVMGVRNDSEESTAVALSSVHIRSDQNGCMIAEISAPGGCAPGKGQLGNHLVFTVAVAAHEAGPYKPTWTGNAAGLKRGVHVRRHLGAGEAVWLRMTASLPRTAGNEVQSDTYAFDLRVSLTGLAGTASHQVHGALGSSGGLADTGTPIELMGAAGLLFLITGLPLALGARATRRRRALPG